MAGIGTFHSAFIVSNFSRGDLNFRLRKKLPFSYVLSVKSSPVQRYQYHIWVGIFVARFRSEYMVMFGSEFHEKKIEKEKKEMK